MMDQNVKKRSVHRVKILIGQLEALQRSVENEDYCTELIQQSYSIQNSLKSLDKLLLQNHLSTHVKHQMQDKKQQEKAIKELVDIYTYSHR